MRLIDADALSKAMYDEAFENDESYNETNPMARWDSGLWIRYKMFEKCLRDAPTIELCEDAISREAAIKLIGDAHFKNYGEAIMLIQELPFVAPSRPSGEWKAKDGVFYCSCCGNDSAGLSEDDVYVYEVPLPNYCQDCGAQMKGANDERV